MKQTKEMKAEENNMHFKLVASGRSLSMSFISTVHWYSINTTSTYIRPTPLQLSYIGCD